MFWKTHTSLNLIFYLFHMSTQPVTSIEKSYITWIWIMACIFWMFMSLQNSDGKQIPIFFFVVLRGRSIWLRPKEISLTSRSHGPLTVIWGGCRLSVLSFLWGGRMCHLFEEGSHLWADLIAATSDLRVIWPCISQPSELWGVCFCCL